MNFFKTFLFVSVLSVTASAQLDTNSQHFYMYSYFINLQEDAGARLAFSTDGINWDRYNNGDPVIVPTIAEGGELPLMRDPNIYYDSLTGIFHLTWTTAWNQSNIGYAYSSDLVNWSDQIMIHVGKEIDGCTCCWAPEFFYDDTRDSIMVYWSTDRGFLSKEAYCSYTKDFRKYTTPKVYFKPRKNGSLTQAYTVIDESITKLADKKYFMVFKDERTVGLAGKKSLNIHYIIGETPSGPWDFSGETYWDNVSQPITNNGCEGASPIIIGNELRVYFDPFGQGPSGTYRMVKINLSDLNFADPFNTPSPWPEGEVLKNELGQNFSLSHGSVSEIPRAKLMQIMYNVPDTKTYQSWSPPTQDDVVVEKEIIPESIYPLGKQNCGCGTGVGLAFFPPIAFRALSLRRRKRKKELKKS
jgi:hypothetical protein